MNGNSIKFDFFSAGTIGSEPEPIESRQFSSKDKLATAGIFGGKSKGNGTYPPTPQPPGSTVPPHPPTTDENLVYGKLSKAFSMHLKPIYLYLVLFNRNPLLLIGFSTTFGKWQI